MALQNRVDPYGRLVAAPERGAWMGNRGVLHDENRRVIAAWRTKRWITCVLHFRGRKREVFAPRRYSELFFLDEVTSLSAGHRPCAECRRDRYNTFCAAWARAHGKAGERPRADDMDAVIHADRVTRGREKKTYEERLSSLPDGVIVEQDGRPHLVKGGRLRPWSFSGYGSAKVVSPSSTVQVLTPKSLVGVIRAGFIPEMHPSAGV